MAVRSLPGQLVCKYIYFKNRNSQNRETNLYTSGETFTEQLVNLASMTSTTP